MTEINTASSGLPLEDLVGNIPWGVEITIGTRLSMEFGQEVLKPKHRQVHGKWHLLLLDCYWRIENSKSIVVGSDDNDLHQAIKKINFGAITSVHIKPPSNDLEITFDGGFRFVTFLSHSRATPEARQWCLFSPGQKVLVAKGAGVVTLQSEDAS